MYCCFSHTYLKMKIGESRSGGENQIKHNFDNRKKMQALFVGSTQHAVNTNGGGMVSSWNYKTAMLQKFRWNEMEQPLGCKPNPRSIRIRLVFKTRDWGTPPRVWGSGGASGGIFFLQPKTRTFFSRPSAGLRGPGGTPDSPPRSGWIRPGSPILKRSVIGFA